MSHLIDMFKDHSAAEGSGSPCGDQANPGGIETSGSSQARWQLGQSWSRWNIHRGQIHLQID